MDGEYVNVAPIEVARVANEYVRRGDKLNAGDRIATFETTDADIAVSNAEAALAQADADLVNILYGRRPEEMAAIEANLKAAQVQQDDAQRTLSRRKDLNALLDLTSVSQVAPFGATLHVVGPDWARMAIELGGYAAQHRLSIEPGLTSLEDVFIHFMGAESGAPARAA